MYKKIIIVLLALILVSCTTVKEYEIIVKNDGLHDRSIIGLGVEWDTYNYSDIKLRGDEFNQLTDYIETMNPSFVRIMMLSKWCYDDGVYSFDNMEMNSLFRVLDYLSEKNIEVVLTDWGVGELGKPERDWLRVEGIIDCEDPVYAEVISTYLSHMVFEKGYDNIMYFVVGNEPNLEISDFSKWHNSIINVSNALQENGLDQHIKLMGSGESGSPKWHEKTILELNHLFDVIDYHGYPEDDTIKSGELFHKILEKNQIVWDEGKQPIIISEAGIAPMDDLDSFLYGLGMADYSIQAINAGISGISAWSFDDNSYPSGFDNSMIKNDTFESRPWFEAWTLLSRGFPKGSLVYKRTYVDDLVRYAIAKVPGGYSIFIVNRSTEPIQLSFSIDDENSYMFNHYIYESSEYKKGATLSPTQKVYDMNAPLVIKVAGQSALLITTLTYQTIGDK